MTWKTIRLELARTPEFPEGSAAHAYVLRLPIDDDGYIERSRDEASIGKPDGPPDMAGRAGSERRGDQPAGRLGFFL